MNTNSQRLIEGAINPKEKFWVIINVAELLELARYDDYHIPEARRPKHVHTDEAKAQAELLHLATNYPGQFVLLEAVGRVERRDLADACPAWFVVPVEGSRELRYNRVRRAELDGIYSPIRANS